MASTALGRGRTERGKSVSFLIGTRLAVDFAAVLQGGDQGHVGNGGRKDAAADGQDFAADANGFGEIAGHVREGGEKEVAKIVADEAAASVKTILEEATKQSFVL